MIMKIQKLNYFKLQFQDNRKIENYQKSNLISKNKKITKKAT